LSWTEGRSPPGGSRNKRRTMFVRGYGPKVSVLSVAYRLSGVLARCLPRAMRIVTANRFGSRTSGGLILSRPPLLTSIRSLHTVCSVSFDGLSDVGQTRLRRIWTSRHFVFSTESLSGSAKRPLSWMNLGVKRRISRRRAVRKDVRNEPQDPRLSSNPHQYLHVSVQCRNASVYNADDVW